MQTHSLPRPWRYLAAKLMRQAMKYALAYSTYTPEKELTIVSRETKKVPHPSTGEMAVAEVVQGQHFRSTRFQGDHKFGWVIEIAKLHHVFVTMPYNLYEKMRNGIKPMAQRLDSEPEIDRIILKVERLAQNYLNDLTALLHEEGLIVESPPYPHLLDQQVRKKAS